MKKILLIGGAGYIGTKLTELFLQNYKVTVYDSLIYKQENPNNFFGLNKNFIFVNDKIENLDKLTNLFHENDYVVYLAGLVGDPITKKYPDLAYSINEFAIINSLKLLQKKNNIIKFFFISTCSNYGILENEFADENSNLNPLSLYAKSKVKCEHFLNTISDSTDTEISILRFATAFGLSRRMRFDLTVNQFVKELAIDKSIDVYDADTWRPYCHIKDFYNIINGLIDKNTNKKFQIYNCGDEINNYTKRSLALELQQKYFPNSNVNFLKSSNDPRNYKVNFSKIHKEINFNAEFTLDNSIQEIIDYVGKYSKNIKDRKYSFGNFIIES